jgi:hypothetical protein
MTPSAGTRDATLTVAPEPHDSLDSVPFAKVYFKQGGTESTDRMKTCTAWPETTDNFSASTSPVVS